MDPDSGWVIDFADLEGPANDVMLDLEHRYLNDVKGLSNPTSENLAIWIWDKVHASVAGLREVVVAEGSDRGCRYRGPGQP